MEDFDQLLNDVLKNPELVLDSNYVSNDQLLALQKKMNPYLSLTDSTDPNVKQIAVCSYTNLREDYLRRYVMTSFIAFIFQVLHEYEVPKEKRTWMPSTNDAKEPFNISSLKAQLIGVIAVLEEAENAEQQEELLNKELNSNELLHESINNAELIKNIYNTEEKKMGLLYTVTTMVKDIGLMADTKLNVTKQLVCKFPEIRYIIQSKKHTTCEFSERELPNANAKDIIYTFLKTWLSFDPSVHIRNGFDQTKVKEDISKIGDQEIKVDIEDPNRITLSSLFQKIDPLPEDKHHVAKLLSNKHMLNTATSVLRDEDLQDSILYMLNNSDRFKQYLLPVSKTSLLPYIPPQDTFHRWSYFTEVNYEELRTITETLYPEKADLDWAIAIWTTFKGTSGEVDEQFKEYCQKHHDELPSSLKALEIGHWSILGDFKENRKNIQFYNKNTDVIKRIIDRHTEDKKIGTELMRNRIRQEKAKNIAEYGPDAPGLKMYKNTIASDGKDLASKGVEKVISPEEMKRLEKTRGNIQAARELEVLEENEKIVKQFEELKTIRPLTEEEQDKYNKSVLFINKAKEMLNVPDDAIQVDVFTTDPTSGEFIKTHFYTKSEEALEKETKLFNKK